jgi:hypothetical protein
MYSVTGQEVETLLDGRLTAGIHEIYWEPNGIAAGVYFCEMHAGGIRKSMKMIYQK